MRTTGGRRRDPWGQPARTSSIWLSDVPYRRYGREPVTAAAIEDLRAFADFRGLDAGSCCRTAAAMMRGTTWLTRLIKTEGGPSRVFQR